MTSGKQARRQRQVARPPTRSTEGRKASPAVLLGALGAVIAIALAVILVVVFTGGSSGSSEATGTTLPDSDTIAQQFQGIPQQGNVLGKASAPVTMVEYIDLQCPICRQFETEVMPTIIERYVRTGKVKVEARPIAFIGPDSQRGRRGMIAAEPEGKAFNFSQILYFNQGPENGGWLSDSMVADAAVSVGLDPQKILDAMDSKAVADKATAYDGQAQADAVSGTPTIFVGTAGAAKPTEVTPGRSPSLEELSAAIDSALKGSGS
jgi:protein-disulfide isomerase